MLFFLSFASRRCTLGLVNPLDREHLGNDSDDLIELHRLGEKGRASGGQYFCARVESNALAESADDRHFSETLLSSANFANSFEAVPSPASPSP